MTGPEIDPLLPLINGRSLEVNNEYRVKLMADAALLQRRDPEGFKGYLAKMLVWAQMEAIARDRLGEPGPRLPQPREPMHRLAAPKG